MLVLVSFSSSLLRLDSHLLQRVAHFNPLSLYCWFSRPPGCISITAKVTHLIREGRIYWHRERGIVKVRFKTKLQLYTHNAKVKIRTLCLETGHML